ncbi:MAG: fumarylacetoacetate hydrolase family protein [Betaproteobacteria bacterium]|jgi:2-keto-4-pentenoate hydratase/2-oxohepta-3-ene-1,7-dioic acid hydratase in catechol pathway
MKLVTYVLKSDSQAKQYLGVLNDKGDVIDLVAEGKKILHKDFPDTMLGFIDAGNVALEDTNRLLKLNPSALALSSVKLLSPIPKYNKNIFCVGRNYKLHILEGARARGVDPTFPPVPELFTKPTTGVIGHEDQIHWDSRVTQQLDYEVELAMVIGKKSINLTAENALSAVFGYTIVNDVSARDAQKAHGQWFKGKGFDTYCPIGPCIVTADEFGSPSGHQLSLKVNGEIRQDSNTVDMLFSCEEILVSLSAGLTLEPGDTIATGTPSGVALGMTPQKWLLDGHVLDLTIEGIGTLTNTVKKIH